MAADQKDDGGAALPVLELNQGQANDDGVHTQHLGLTKREWFSCQVLAGLVADPQLRGQPEDFAKWAVANADALIAELKK